MTNNSFSLFAWNIFEKSIQDYHIHDDVDISEKILTKREVWNIFFTPRIGLIPFNGI